MFPWPCVVAFALARCSVFAGHSMTGQPYAVPRNLTRVRFAARFAVSEFNRELAEEPFTYILLNITSARIQVNALFQNFSRIWENTDMNLATSCRSRLGWSTSWKWSWDSVSRGTWCRLTPVFTSLNPGWVHVLSYTRCQIIHTWKIRLIYFCLEICVACNPACFHISSYLINGHV